MTVQRNFCRSQGRDLLVDLRHRNHPPSGANPPASAGLNAPLHRGGASSWEVPAFSRWRDVQEDDRLPRPARHPAAGCSAISTAPGSSPLQPARSRHHRRAFRGADLKPGEMVVVTGKRHREPFPVRPQKSRFCIFEYVYFCPARILRSKVAMSTTCARRSAAEAGAREPRRSRYRWCRGPTQAPPSAIALRRPPHSFELGHHPQPLCRAYLHPADGCHSSHGRAAQAPMPTARCSRARGSSWSTIIHRARDDQPEDRADGSRTPGASRSPHAHRLAADARLLLLWRRHARDGKAAGQPHDDSEESAKFIRVDSLGFLTIAGPSTGAVGNDLHPRAPNDRPPYCAACFTRDHPTGLTAFRRARTMCAPCPVPGGQRLRQASRHRVQPARIPAHDQPDAAPDAPRWRASPRAHAAGTSRVPTGPLPVQPRRRCRAASGFFRATAGSRQAARAMAVTVARVATTRVAALGCTSARRPSRFRPFPRVARSKPRPCSPPLWWRCKGRPQQ